MIRHDIAAFEISNVGKWHEWNQTSECDRFVVKISEPPISVGEMARLQLWPFRHEFIKGVDCLCEGDAINLVDSIGHLRLAQIALLITSDLHDFDGQQFSRTTAPDSGRGEFGGVALDCKSDPCAVNIVGSNPSLPTKIPLARLLEPFALEAKGP